MRTGLTKQEKTTDIWFDEKDPLIHIRTHNTDLKKRLLAYSRRYPAICQQTDTGVHGRNLHGGFFIHLLPGIGTAKHKGLPGIADIIRDLRQTLFRLFCFGRISRILKSHPFPESH